MACSASTGLERFCARATRFVLAHEDTLGGMNWVCVGGAGVRQFRYDTRGGLGHHWRLPGGLNQRL